MHLTLQEARDRARQVRAAFFDMDGTLLSNTTHVVPPSAVEALHALQDAGVALYIASGRQPAEVAVALDGKLDIAFDGMITMSGSYCYDAQGVFRSETIPREDVAAIVRQAQKGRYHLLVSELGRTYCDAPKAQIVRDLEEELNLHYEPADLSQALEHDVYQFCGFLHAEDDHLITDVAPHVRTTRWHPLFCDVIPIDSGKPEGVRLACERRGLGLENAIAFGDGENDESMLRAVGLGVAMGNGDEASRGAADYITDTVDEHGIWNACVRLGLIEGEPR